MDQRSAHRPRGNCSRVSRREPRVCRGATPEKPLLPSDTPPYATREMKPSNIGRRGQSPEYLLPYARGKPAAAKTPRIDARGYDMKRLAVSLWICFAGYCGYNNVAPLAFGMTPPEAAAALGVPLAYYSTYRGSEIYVAY